MQMSADLQVNHSGWNRFSLLEQELDESKAFIEIHKDNYHLASEKYEAIVMKACAEIEKIYQQISGKILEVKNNIASYIHSITNHCKDFFHTEIIMPMHNDNIKPWEACADEKDPEFWSIYHAIKHEGASGVVTLKHAIHALAGLFALLLALDD